MPQMIVNFTDYENAIVNIVKGKYNLKNKNDAIKHIIQEYEIEFLEPELRPEFVKRMKKIQKEKPVEIDNPWQYFGVNREG